MSQQTLDVLELLEAAYRTDLADGVWLRDVVRRAERVVGQGLGLSGYFVDASRPDGFVAWGFASTGMDEQAERERFDLWSATAPVTLKRHAHLHGPACFASQLPPANIARRAFEQSFEITGHADILGITAIDGSGLGCALAVPCPERVTRPPAEVDHMIWERMAAHLAAALRLRRSGDADEPLATDVVINPGGKVAHAEGDAKSPATLETLRDAAARFDRARTRRKACDPVQTTTLWQALVAGRWTLIDHFERDGRRYIVARPNEPVVDPFSNLTKRESQVVRAAAFGHSNKLIAYELGISASTVSLCLRRAADKLGVANRLELIRLCAARFGSCPPELQAHGAS